MTDQEIRERLSGIFQEVFDSNDIQIRPETTAKDVPGWDSFSNINLMIAVEIGFEVKFSSKEIEGLANVGALIGLIRERTPI